MSHHRVVLTEGRTRSDPPLCVLAEFPPGTPGTAVRAEAERLAALHPGKVVAVEWFSEGVATWTRYQWVGADFPFQPASASTGGSRSRRKKTQAPGPEQV